MNMYCSQIFYDDINTTWTVASSVLYAPMPGSTAFTAQSNNPRAYQLQKNNATSARFIVGDEGVGLTEASWEASFTGTAGNTLYHVALFRNGTKMDVTSKERKIGTAGDVGASAGGGCFVTHVNDVIDLRVNAGGTTGVQVTFTHCRFGVELISTSTILVDY